MGTIYAACCALGTSYYDDTLINEKLLEGLDKLTTSNDYVEGADATDLRGNYHNIFSRFDTFCSQQRKDCLFVADPLLRMHLCQLGEGQ